MNNFFLNTKTTTKNNKIHDIPWSKLGLLGVDSLGGDCMSIPADWGS